MSRTSEGNLWLANKGPKKIREDAAEERCQVSRLNIENTRGKWHSTLQRDKAAAGLNREDDGCTERLGRRFDRQKPGCQLSRGYVGETAGGPIMNNRSCLETFVREINKEIQRGEALLFVHRVEKFKDEEFDR
ncbi:hypothetical protein K0M31_011834 [Melipona bicolor]|uniref:Uncharacterized protein n=1 Tax=Melipona bicolor TaxID=60889 RepID=A0AA40GAK7_9HYME|nr:hypothetical protein K0M31_011834 [Melipona bicolor]